MTIIERIEELRQWIKDTLDSDRDIMNGKEIAKKADLINELKPYAEQFERLQASSQKMREVLEKAKIHFEVIEESFSGMNCKGILFDINEALKN